MPFPQAKPLHVSPLQQELLQRMVQRTTNAQRLVERGHIILEAAKGMSNTKIAQHQQVDYETVRRWRDRWHAAEARLQAVEVTGKPKLLSQAIEVLLSDESSGARPSRLSAQSTPAAYSSSTESCLASSADA